VIVETIAATQTPKNQINASDFMYSGHHAVNASGTTSSGGSAWSVQKSIRRSAIT